jgi:diguanylate cyclase (GGDEF)-like protein
MPGATVLVVDDSLVIRAVVRLSLEEAGYTVVEADSGLAAVDACRRCTPDVVLLDIEMPGMDGHEVLAMLKVDDDLKDVPVVFLTGRTGVDDLVSGMHGGAHDYLKKPFEPAELLARVGAAANVKRLQDELRRRNVELEHLSRTDLLTGLHNRRHFEDELARAHSAAIRHDEPFAVVLLDIDHFKRVNDTYGHAVGDDVLREFARRLADELRLQDTACRWGGEEFVILLPRTDIIGAAEVAERVRTSIGAAVLSDEYTIRVTVSGGCAEGPAASVDEVLREADQQLYRAKNAGRDQIHWTYP